MKNYLAIGLVLAVIAGCGNQDQPKTAAPLPLAARQDAPPGAVTPPPAPASAVDDGVQRPTPGQAGDHSSPGFKAGGKSDPKK
jgi:hypothetical protein